jgi:glycosyltransferase involved in cell wall biosynthesis
LARLASRLVQGGGLQPHEWTIFARLQQLKPDIIHAHDLPRLAVAVYAKQRLRLPLIYDAHELYPEIATLSRHQQRVLTRLEQRLVPTCSHIITVNPFLAAEMATRYRISPPTVILNATSRPAGFDEAQPWDCFRRCFAIPAEASIVLYQGWMSPTRGLQHLVRAMFYLGENIHLVLMGYGETRRELEQIVAELGLAERVHFKAAVPQAALLFWTASADAGIIPYPPVDLNNYYCSPNKLFEFIQACVPIIANDLPFLRQIVGGEGFGVVAPLTTVEDYVAAIQQMFDPQLGGPARFQARLQAGVQTYAWDVEAKKLLAIYEEFIPQPS